MTPDHPSPRIGRAEQAHSLKTWPVYFAGLLSGAKTFEVRVNDRDFLVGDTLRLHEWEPSSGEFTGRVIERRVTYVLPLSKLKILANGVDYVVMGLSSALEAEIASLRAENELRKRERDAIPLCPDCRDKVRWEKECLRCHFQRLEAQLLAARAEIEELRADLDTERLSNDVYCERTKQAEAQLLAAREERHQIEQEAQRLRGALERIQNLMQHPDEQLAWLRIERAIEAALLPCDPPQETTTNETH